MSGRVFGPWKRRRRNPNKPKRPKWGKQLEEGMQGIIITSRNSTERCVTEALSLLTEYGDLLYGPEKQCEKDEEQEEDDDDDEGESAQTAPEKQVNQNHTSTEKNLRRFETVESGKNALFIRSFNVEPEKLVHYILKDLYTTKQKKTQCLIRMSPVCGSCRADLEHIREYGKTFFQPWFKAPNKGNFQIEYKNRYNPILIRETVVNELTDVLIRMNPLNRFDLVNPDYTIVVEIIRNIFCLGVVKDYDLFKRYNLEEVIKEEGKEKG